MRYLGSKDALLPAIHSLLTSKGLMNQRYRFLMHSVAPELLPIA